MNYIPTFEQFFNESYNAAKKYWLQGDDWDSIFKNYQEYLDIMKNRSFLPVEVWLVDRMYLPKNDPIIISYNKYTRKKSIVSSFPKWVREENIEAPISKEKTKYKIGDKVSGKTVRGNEIEGIITHLINDEYAEIKTDSINIYKSRLNTLKSV